MIVSTRVTVGTVAVQLVPPHNNPQEVKLVNTGAEIVRIGNSASVTTDSYGLARLPDSPNTTRNIWEFDLGAGEEVWALTASGTCVVNVWIRKK